MADIQTLNSLDEALAISAKYVKPLFYCEPTNEKDQKKEFLTGKILNPEFTYRDLEYDPQEVSKNLEAIEIPDDELGAIFEKKKRDTLLENKIVANRGKKDLVREATITIYGSPSKQLVSYADELLRQIPNLEATKNVSSYQVRDVLQRALQNHGLADWQVELSDKKLTTVYASEKKITVCRDRKFAAIDSERLKVHEVGVHALRAANGFEQPLKIFSTGLPGYLPTEEGLSSYFEELTGNTNPEVMRDYASRVIAVDSVGQDLNFRQTFDRLKNYDLTNDQAWNVAVRAHRAGGYIKDHVYLDGHRKVKEFAANGGDFNVLYVGKVGIEDLPLVKRLLQEGALKKAKYIPHFI